MARRKHIPQRMCVACRQSQDKKSLVRVVRTPQGVVVDESGKLPGRGAYLHSDPDCWQKGITGYLSKALNTELSAADRESLMAYWESSSRKPVDSTEDRSGEVGRIPSSSR